MLGFGRHLSTQRWDYAEGGYFPQGDGRRCGRAPEADLFDAQELKIGRHYGGPTWESADGSKIVGEMKAREPSPDVNAIPWLLLTAKTHEGQGVMSLITSIQRLETAGGKAPAGGADQSTADQELRVPYTAVYYFYAPKP